MKILFPIGSFFPAQTGGPNNTVYWISRALIEKGHDVTIVTSNIGLNSCEIPQGKWLDLYYGKTIYFPEKFHYFPRKLIFTSIKEVFKTDIIHLNSLFYPPSWIVVIFAILSKRPVVWSPRGELDPEALVYSKWKKRPLLWLIKIFLKNKVFFHATSCLEHSYIQNQFGNRTNIVIIPNYMFLPEKINTERGKPYFLYIGRIHPKKAIDNLIHALSFSEKFKSSEFHLKIAGNHSNKYGKSLKSLVHELKLDEKVHFLGHIEGISKQKLFAEAYFSFLPSHTENFGNVVIESLAQSTPVVASITTPWQDLESYDAGFWVNNSPESLAKVIDTIIQMPEKDYLIYRQNAFNLVQTHFDVNRGIHKWIEAYEHIQQRKGSPYCNHSHL